MAAHQVGATGKVIGVDMTEEMLAKSRSTVSMLGWANIEFRHGLAEALPVQDGWADVVISNGVINEGACDAKAACLKAAALTRSTDGGSGRVERGGPI